MNRGLSVAHPSSFVGDTPRALDRRWSMPRVGFEHPDSSLRTCSHEILAHSQRVLARPPHAPEPLGSDLHVGPASNYRHKVRRSTGYRRPRVESAGSMAG